MRRPAIFLVGGPSGAGKDTLLMGARDQCDRLGAPVVFLHREITRAAELCTEIEIPVDAATFDASSAAGEYALSWSAHGGVKYAIAHKTLNAALSAHPPHSIVLNVTRSIIDLVLETYGAQADVFVLLISASPTALRTRLRARGRESEEAIEKRVAQATAYELVRVGSGGLGWGGVRGEGGGGLRWGGLRWCATKCDGMGEEGWC